jgi:hypothetical protein
MADFSSDVEHASRAAPKERLARDAIVAGMARAQSTEQGMRFESAFELFASLSGCCASGARVGVAACRAMRAWLNRV